MVQSPSRPVRSLCFVAFDATPLIFPDAHGSIGGAETRVLLMARALSVESGVKVFIAVRDSRARSPQIVDGIHVITTTDRLFRIRRFVSEHVTVLPSFPWLRIRRWRSRLIWQIPLLFVARLFRPSSPHEVSYDWLVNEANCDTYCCMGASRRTSEVFRTAKQYGRRTVLFIASDADLDGRYISDPNFINEYGDRGEDCADAIRSADLIVCQTTVQQQRLSDRFGRESVRLPNPFDHHDWNRKLQSLQRTTGTSAGIPQRFVFWIGRSDRHHKRPHLLLQIAARCPEIPFVMIMNTENEEVAAEVCSGCPPNVQIRKRVPFSEMPLYFQHSAIFLSTGSKAFEGFPNVFLQAAATHVPIVSLEADPGFIRECSAGVVCDGDIDLLIQEVKRLWNDSELAETLGNNGYDYVCREHSPEDTRRQLLEIVDAVR